MPPLLFPSMTMTFVKFQNISYIYPNDQSQQHYLLTIFLTLRPHKIDRNVKNNWNIHDETKLFIFISFPLLQIYSSCIQERMVEQSILKKASCAFSPKSTRYDPDFLLECVLFRIKSRAAYNHLRINNKLPLPCGETIRRLLSCMSCTFGLNGFALDAIKKNFVGKPVYMRYGTQVWDEMSIEERVPSIL